jgi:hypothetical protein
MPKPRRGNNSTKQLDLSDSAVVRIADELERRIWKLLRPDPTPTPEVSPRHIDLDDLLTPQKAAHLYGKSDQTIYRWITRFDISECIAGTVLISRRKLDAHLARGGAPNNS